MHKAARIALFTGPEHVRSASADAGGPLLSLLRVLQFGDSMLPTGGFAFSCGLEAAVQQGVVRDATTLRAFTLTALEQAAHGDAVAVARALRSASGARREQTARPQGFCELEDLDHEVFARKLNEEARHMTVRMGKKFAEMSVAISDGLLPAQWLQRIRENRVPGTYPIAMAVFFADMGLTVEQGLAVHQYSVAMTVLNAALRLLRVSHLDTQSLLFGLGPALEAQCRLAAELPLERMSNYAPMLDILAAVHVQAHVRLFMN